MDDWKLATEPEFDENELRVIAGSYLGFGLNYSLEEYKVGLAGYQMMELERLVRWFTEGLATYNALGPGKQETLDTLNEVWEILNKASEEKKIKDWDDKK